MAAPKASKVMHNLKDGESACLLDAPEFEETFLPSHSSALEMPLLVRMVLSVRATEVISVNAKDH